MLHGKNFKNLSGKSTGKSYSGSCKTLDNGGLIIYPSDTVYALGCNIFDIKAMEKLAQIKGVKLEKAHFSIICNDLSHLSEFTRPIDTATFRLLKHYLPGPFTFILEANKTLPLAYKGQNHRNPGSGSSYSTTYCFQTGTSYRFYFY